MSGDWGSDFFDEMARMKVKATEVIVCAACQFRDDPMVVICGARHWDSTMRVQFQSIKFTIDYQAGQSLDTNDFTQGFIDQFGKFYNREDAMQVVKNSGQKISYTRNRSATKLYSEGLY